jgi:chromosome partitioning protein
MIISVFATKSSTKTSISISMAVYLKNLGYDVLLADLDTQSSASDWLDYRSDNQNLKQIASVKKNGKNVARDITELAIKYDYVICDCGGKDYLAGRLSLLAADIAIVPIFPTNLSLLTLESSLAAVNEAKSFNEKLKVVIVITGVNSNVLVKDTQEARDLINAMITDMDCCVLAKNCITTRKIWSDITPLGLGISESGHAKASLQFEGLMKEIIKK